MSTLAFLGGVMPGRMVHEEIAVRPPVAFREIAQAASGSGLDLLRGHSAH